MVLLKQYKTESVFLQPGKIADSCSVSDDDDLYDKTIILDFFLYVLLSSQVSSILHLFYSYARHPKHPSDKQSKYTRFPYLFLCCFCLGFLLRSRCWHFFCMPIRDINQNAWGFFTAVWATKITSIGYFMIISH